MFRNPRLPAPSAAAPAPVHEAEAEPLLWWGWLDKTGDIASLGVLWRPRLVLLTPQQLHYFAPPSDIQPNTLMDALANALARAPANGGYRTVLECSRFKHKGCIPVAQILSSQRELHGSYHVLNVFLRSTRRTYHFGTYYETVAAKVHAQLVQLLDARAGSNAPNNVRWQGWLDTSLQEGRCQYFVLRLTELQYWPSRDDFQATLRPSSELLTPQPAGSIQVRDIDCVDIAKAQNGAFRIVTSDRTYTLKADNMTTLRPLLDILQAQGVNLGGIAHETVTAIHTKAPVHLLRRQQAFRGFQPLSLTSTKYRVVAQRGVSVFTNLADSTPSAAFSLGEVLDVFNRSPGVTEWADKLETDEGWISEYGTINVRNVIPVALTSSNLEITINSITIDESRPPQNAGCLPCICPRVYPALYNFNVTLGKSITWEISRTFTELSTLKRKIDIQYVPNPQHRRRRRSSRPTRTSANLSAPFPSKDVNPQNKKDTDNAKAVIEMFLSDVLSKLDICDFPPLEIFIRTRVEGTLCPTPANSFDATNMKSPLLSLMHVNPTNWGAFLFQASCDLDKMLESANFADGKSSETHKLPVRIGETSSDPKCKQPLRVQLKKSSSKKFDVNVEDRDIPMSNKEYPWYMKLLVHGVDGVPQGFLGSSRDCYVLAKCGNEEYKTDKRLNTLAPKWEPAFELLIGVQHPDHDSVLLSLYDWDRYFDDEPLGDCKLNTKDFKLQHGMTDMTLTLVTPFTGAQSTAKLRISGVLLTKEQKSLFRVDVVYEHEAWSTINQRWVPHTPHYLNESGLDSGQGGEDFIAVASPLPQDFVISQTWAYVTVGGDHSGWFYASSIHSDLWYSVETTGTMIRRRRWTRMAHHSSITGGI